MAKKRKNRMNTADNTQGSAADKRLIYGNILRTLCLVAVTMIVFCLYRFLLNRFYFEYVLIPYMSIATVATLAYVIYNRGFSRKGLTPEMLPDTMSSEEKAEFIDDGKRRLRKSRPLLIVVVAFAFTFIVDIIELFVIPFIQNIFGK